MATHEQWTAFKDALHGEFQRNNQDPTWNYEIDEAEMTLRIPHFGGDLTEKLRFDIAEKDLRNPAALAASIYAAALRPD
ncbi:MAG: hypothetical protein ACREMZ_12850 [Gemmatimonadales bacterium]